MPTGLNGDTLLNGGALAAVTTFILSLIKPFVEKIPFLRPDSSVHDATIRILNVVINALTVVALNVQAGSFNVNNWLTYLLVALGQAIASQGFYSAIASTSGATQATQAVKTPQPIGHPVRW